MLLGVLLLLFVASSVWRAGQTAVDDRVLVVTLQQDVDPRARALVARTCAAQAGVDVVPDVGSPEQVARFPLRFALQGTGTGEYSRLVGCLDSERFGDLLRTYEIESKST